MTKIIIVGGGFGGINLATGLANSKSYQVTLVDRNNYNFFPPLIYQVATAYLEPSNISYPFRKRLLLGHLSIKFKLSQIKMDQALNEKKEKKIFSDVTVNCLYAIPNKHHILKEDEETQPS